jgi:FHA domain
VLVCPAGHESTASDYCDVCGLSMEAPAGGEQTAPAGLSAVAVQPAGPCPQCGAPGLGRFCEVCGYSTEPQPVGHAPESSWTAVITASRACYETVLAGGGLDASAVLFPDDYPERRIPLTGSQLRIGRRSVSREVTPEIDLTGPPADPAISRLHAVLVAQPDGSWAVIDPGSENGISVNGAGVAVGDLVPLRHGDCISVGAWTAITIVGG